MTDAEHAAVFQEMLDRLTFEGAYQGLRRRRAEARS